ncbi:MAG: tRNA preQ1(34) S-adenosylmethionine ribosyltransferase-isomerase QueA [Gemmatimonadales bacterium]|nr:tRNA preQ1(34) S-adenosylmethionine ribosyltransferase-isomerase QueA [Gemmatimonadales bacterium]
MPPAYQTSDFAYELPAGLIAQEPIAERGASRLLLVDRTAPDPDRAATDLHFPDLVALVPAGDLLVLNTTRVRHARFLATRPSGAPAEVLLIHPAQGEHWIAIGKPGSALRPGKRVAIGPGAWIETVAVLDEGYREVRFVGTTAAAAMAAAGRLPLPPYIDRAPTPADETRYQTVFAEREGSVAAPTAGLHFTPALLAALEAKGVELARIELEVGPGTFKPVEVEDPLAHPMHREVYDIPVPAAEAIRRLRDRGGKLWAVGTTVVRALESAAADGGTVRAGTGETRLLITPGYGFRVVDRLLTNFHLPRSTLLMLVAAFGGYDRVMAAYRHAVAAGYRFYSYGDAMLLR